MVFIQLTIPASAFAGTIGFTIEFKDQQVSIVNKGSDAVYNLSMWSLNPDMQWQPLRITQGNTSYSAPEGKLVGQRLQPLPAGPIGIANPLLIQLQDQAGSTITQLAWQYAPQPTQYSLPLQRMGNQVQVLSAENAGRLTQSMAIIAPYTRIVALTQALSEPATPANPKVHQWLNQPNLTIDTGAGQGGIWWVHQTTSGALELQMVPDGIARGTEQVPPWLMFARQYLLQLSVFLALLGFCCLLAGLLQRNENKAPKSKKTFK